MGEKIYDFFKGQNSLLDPSLIGMSALSCKNLSFRDGKLRAFKGDTAIGSVTLSSDRKAAEYFNASWRVFTGGGWGRWTFNHWKISDADLLIQARPESLSKSYWISEADPAGSSIKTVSLGLPTPQITTQPAGAGSGSEPQAGTYQYAVTLERTLYNHVTESDPVISDEVTIASAQNIDIVMTNADASIDTDYYTAIGEMKFNLYRLFGSEYLFVKSVAVNPTTSSNTTITDDVADDDLGAVLPTQFQSLRTGNVISYTEPPAGSSRVFGGISREPYAGLIFIWDGNTVRWCDTLKPDAWPSDFNSNFPDTVLDVVVANQAVYVITTKRVFISQSTDPQAIEFVELDGVPGATSWSADEYRGSVYFVAEDGIYQVRGYEAINITKKFLPKDFFRFHSEDVTTLNLRYTTLAVMNDYLYLSVLKNDGDEGENYILDLRTLDICDWNDETVWYQRFIKDGAKKGVIYGEKWDQDGGTDNIIPNGDNNLVEVGTGSDLAWEWRAGDLMLRKLKSDGFHEVEAQGSGTVSLESFLDGSSQNTKTLVFTNENGRTLGFNEQKIARSCSFKLSSTDGTGVVTEVAVRGK